MSPPQAHLEAAVRTIIASACANHEPLHRDGLVDTPRRVSRAWLAMAGSRMATSLSRSFSTNSLDSNQNAPPSDIIRGALFDEPDVDGLGFVLVKDITFACLNRDTLLPMYGTCHVAYVPQDGSIIGLSKLSRVVSSVCSRSLLSPRELCRSVIDMISEFSGGVGVVVRSNYGVFSSRNGLDVGLFDELLALVDVRDPLEEGIHHTSELDAQNERSELGSGESPPPATDHHHQHPVAGATEPSKLAVNSENSEKSEKSEKSNILLEQRAMSEKHRAIARAVGTLLEGIGEDAASASSVRAANSYASWFLDATSGYYVGERDDVDVWPLEHGSLDHRGASDGECPRGECNHAETSGKNTMALAVPFTSQCEHHLLPFEGHIGVMLVGPKAAADFAAPELEKRIMGVCSHHVSRFSKRLQVQERLTQQVASVLWERLRPLCQHLLVLVECKHLCMIARGVQQHRSATVTQTVRSEATEDLGSSRLELMRALKRKIETDTRLLYRGTVDDLSM